MSHGNVRRPKLNKPGHRIREVWLFIAIDADGDEGLTGFRSGNTWIPMVCTDEERMLSLKDTARSIAQLSGERIELVKFGGERQTLEVFEP